MSLYVLLLEITFKGWQLWQSKSESIKASTVSIDQTQSNGVFNKEITLIICNKVIEKYL